MREIDNARSGWATLAAAIFDVPLIVSHIDRIFAFGLEERCMCRVCGAKTYSRSFEHVLQLGAPKHATESVTLSDLYAHFCLPLTKPMLCSACVVETLHCVQQRVCTQPNILMVSVPKQLPVIVDEDLSASGLGDFELAAVFCHAGRPHFSGRYSCVCRGPGHRFYNFDGEACSALGSGMPRLKPRETCLVAYTRRGGSAIFEGISDTLGLSDGIFAEQSSSFHRFLMCFGSRAQCCAWVEQHAAASIGDAWQDCEVEEVMRCLSGKDGFDEAVQTERSGLLMRAFISTLLKKRTKVQLVSGRAGVVKQACLTSIPVGCSPGILPGGGACTPTVGQTVPALQSVGPCRRSALACRADDRTKSWEAMGLGFLNRGEGVRRRPVSDSLSSVTGDAPRVEDRPAPSISAKGPVVLDSPAKRNLAVDTSATLSDAEDSAVPSSGRVKQRYEVVGDGGFSHWGALPFEESLLFNRLMGLHVPGDIAVTVCAGLRERFGEAVAFELASEGWFADLEAWRHFADDVSDVALALGCLFYSITLNGQHAPNIS